jgi:hypothetical protein
MHNKMSQKLVHNLACSSILIFIILVLAISCIISVDVVTFINGQNIGWHRNLPTAVYHYGNGRTGLAMSMDQVGLTLNDARA